MHPTESLTTMSFANFLRETDAVGLFVFGLLVADVHRLVVLHLPEVRARRPDPHALQPRRLDVLEDAGRPGDRLPGAAARLGAVLEDRARRRVRDAAPRPAHRGPRRRHAAPGRVPRPGAARRDQPRDGTPRDGPHVPRHGGQHGAVRRPVRHGVGHLPRAGAHRCVRRDLARPGGRPGRRGADHDGARPRGRGARGARLQPAGAQQPRDHRELPRLRRGPARLPDHRRARALLDGPPPRPSPAKQAA